MPRAGRGTPTRCDKSPRWVGGPWMQRSTELHAQQKRVSYPVPPSPQRVVRATQRPPRLQSVGDPGPSAPSPSAFALRGPAAEVRAGLPVIRARRSASRGRMVAWDA
ncbi:hypothetical protein Asi02nite_06240 [Asanoa siamensis]|uniref:Uncharacterized protein n=1 Tax=Asanoa siamensis TaxID=926357 RepID=A0ABQ4CIH5_9ACTN|nr:hypothetical protein Asi02nite_06240 [Asanoa siamensis]